MTEMTWINVHWHIHTGQNKCHVPFCVQISAMIPDCVVGGYPPKWIHKYALVKKVILQAPVLTHWGRDNMAAISQTTLSNAFLNENLWISIKISLKFVPKSPIDNIPALFQIMAWRRPGDKPLPEAMMVILLTHICVARPQWVNRFWFK